MTRSKVRLRPRALAFIFLSCSIIQVTVAQNSREVRTMSLQISSGAFAPGTSIPRANTCDGQDISPALSWSGAPQGTKSFALIVDDPDAPVGTWTHWLIWNIPASSSGLPEHVSRQTHLPDGAQQGQNDFRKLGYNGPCPPPGKPHRYFFTLYALNADIDVKPGASRRELETALKPHVLSEANLIGTYGR